VSKVIVVGSLNIDVINSVDHLPLAGETVKGLKTEYSQGGKGANQAAAASCSGGQVILMGAIGTDFQGLMLKEILRSIGVGVELIVKKEGNIGHAFITVDAQGENHIILSEGANGELTTEDVEPFKNELEGVDIVLLQNEIPWEVNSFVMMEAHRRGIPVLFNPAPAMKIPLDSLPFIDMLILNESEAEYISGVPVMDFPTAEQAGKKILDDGAKSVIITLGEKGSLYVSERNGSIVTPAFHVKAVDTTAAGDTFIGAFAVAKGSNYSIEECIRYASGAAAIAVTRHGALQSIPKRKDIEQFLKDHT
jgi:ribokinase